MSAGEIQSFISNLGFPVALVITLLWFGYKVWIHFIIINEKREDKLVIIINDTNELNRELSKTNEKITSINEKIVEHLTHDVTKLKDDVGDIKTMLIKK